MNGSHSQAQPQNQPQHGLIIQEVIYILDKVGGKVFILMAAYEWLCRH